MTPRVKIHLFGAPVITDLEGRPLDLGGKKVLALIAFLGTEIERPHSREELAALLWGDTGEERARHNLRQAISRIRHKADDLLISEGDLVRLNLEVCDVDVHEFRRLPGQDDVRELERGLKICQQDFLAGTSVRESQFDEWLRDRRAEFREIASEAIDRLAAGLIGEGRIEDSIEVTRRQLTIDPAREQSHVRLMELLAESGRRSDALRQYEKCVEVLSRELGVEPSAETQEAYQRILRRPNASQDPRARRDSTKTDAGSDLPTIAVLPFENLSGEEQRYFADGLAEDIIVALSRFSSLLVIARESSFSYRDPGVSPEKIGRDLGARFLVKGKLRIDDARLRLSVQLVDSFSCKYMWAESFDREIDDVFALQREVAETLVSILAGRVEAARLADVRRSPVSSLDAYECVLRGKEYHHRVTVEDCERAIQMFERAIARDPDYAPAHAWLGCALGQAMSLRPELREELLGRAEAAAEQARLLDDTESESYRILAQVALQRGDLKRARSYQERALALNPNDDRSVCAMGTILTLGGDPSEGEQWIRRAMRINPYHPESVWFHLARALFHGRQERAALESLDKITRNGVREWVYQIAALQHSGNHEGARAAIDELRHVTPDFDAADWVARIPFENETDRAFLLDVLIEAGCPSKQLE